jgi:deoxyribodipyrimidine photo-lyase
MSSIVWLRRDLRLHDHPALCAALAAGGGLIPCFCLDPRLLAGRHASGPRTQFMLECLADLDVSLRERGSRLVVRHGEPERVLPELARRAGAATVHLSADAGGFARERDRRVEEALRRDGVRAILHPGVFAVDDLEALRTTSGGPYTVFTPFHRAWLREPRRRPLPAARSLPPLPAGLDPGRLPALGELGLAQECAEPAPGGEQAGRRAMGRFLDGPVEGYAEGRNLLDGRHVSRLSPHLHLGTISPRELEARLPDSLGGEAYRRQLCWRDFYAHVLRHFPANAAAEYQQRHRIDWRRDEAGFAAWQEGRTGYPLVDAGMRQLRREGWMHNRARLIVGSFLTKDLGIDWRWGERWFMRLLLDGDQPSNNGNWQWIASVGVDPQPVSRRIFNPARQQRRFDPDGAYVRRYVPELGAVADEHLAEPWRMPAQAQRAAGCRVGRDYPEPIVDHVLARAQALARYRRPGP